MQAAFRRDTQQLCREPAIAVAEHEGALRPFQPRQKAIAAAFERPAEAEIFHPAIRLRKPVETLRHRSGHAISASGVSSATSASARTWVRSRRPRTCSSSNSASTPAAAASAMPRDGPALTASRRAATRQTAAADGKCCPRNLVAGSRYPLHGASPGSDGRAVQPADQREQAGDRSDVHCCHARNQARA